MKLGERFSSSEKRSRAANRLLHSISLWTQSNAVVVAVEKEQCSRCLPADISRRHYSIWIDRSTIAAELSLPSMDIISRTQLVAGVVVEKKLPSLHSAVGTSHRTYFGTIRFDV